MIERAKLRRMSRRYRGLDVGRRATFKFADGPMECVSFSKSDLKLQKVAELIKDQKPLAVCMIAAGLPWWATARDWYPIEARKKTKAP